jgi:hypothetical protein
MGLDLALPIPPPDVVPLPLPAFVFKVLLLVTFGIHILAVDIGVGGSMVCLLLALRGRKSPPHAAIARAIAVVLPPAVTFAITLGVAPLLFVQLLYGRFLYTSSILMAIPWISFIVALIAGYALLYRHTGLLKGGRFSLAVGVSSALLLLWIGFLWTNNTTMMLRPDRWSEIAQSASHGGTLNLGDPSVIPRFLHMALAMLAAAALFLGSSTIFLDDKAPFDVALARRFGMRTFAIASIAQIAFGPSVILLQRPDIRTALLGSTRVLAALGLGVPAAIGAIVTAFRGAEPSSGRRGVILPFALIHVTIAAMVVLRDAVRDISLQAAGFDVEATPARIDLLSTALFIVAVAMAVFAFKLMFGWLKQGKAQPVARARPSVEVSHGG